MTQQIPSALIADGAISPAKLSTGGPSWDTSGNLTASANVTAYSDIRLKKDLDPIREAVAKVKALTGYTYTRTDSGERQTGLVAQDVQRVLPEAVLEGEHLSVAYGSPDETLSARCYVNRRSDPEKSSRNRMGIRTDSR